MHVEGASNFMTPLRLVHPPERMERPGGVPEVKPVQARPASGVTQTQPLARPADSYNFEAIYSTRLQRVPWTAAHSRLEKLRASLVAARTQVPIYFTDPVLRRSINPYDPSYMRIAPTPPEINTTAVEQLSSPVASHLPI